MHIIGSLLRFFKSAMSQDPCVLVQCIAVNIRFLLTMYKGDAARFEFSAVQSIFLHTIFKGAGNGFLWFADMQHM
jgi:hypothetical protein